MARALTGEVEGAIADYQFFIDSGQGYNVEWRVVWLERLEAGEDPLEIFDEETLDTLKNE